MTMSELEMECERQIESMTMRYKIRERELDRFLYFVHERHHVWCRRMQGYSAPYTDDRQLASLSFCNVYRVLDRGSQQMVRWLNSDEMMHASFSDVLILCWLYRRTNNTDGWFRAVTRFGLPKYDNWEQWLDEVQKSDIQIVSGVPYNVCNGGRRGIPILSTLSGRTRIAIDSGMMPTSANGSHVLAIEQMSEAPGMGEFLAQQIWTDVGYSVYGSENWENFFVFSGPGSRRGLSWLTGYDWSLSSSARSRLAFSETVRRLRNIISRRDDTVRLSTPKDPQRQLSLMDVQNCLCEFDKWMRCRNGGTYRRRFTSTRQLSYPVFPSTW